MPASSQKVTFPGSQGGSLAARLDMPPGSPRAWALFAHCFTCSKDIFAAARIASELTDRGFAVFRFDFTGLGASEGEFANTNFSSNMADLRHAIAYLRKNHQAPSVLIGHSLGGAAVLGIAGDVPEVKAVATIGAPSDAEHVIKNFGANIDEIEREGVAEVQLAGRKFTIKKQFLDDVKGHTLTDRVAAMRKALLLFHSPVDNVVGIENASAIFAAAKHPKSFISLDDADHLLSRRTDAAYAAEVMSAWASRYVSAEEAEGRPDEADEEGLVSVAETGHGKFQQDIASGPHRLLADEPVSHGGMDSGPSPYDLLNMALGACTSMTLRMYADRKKLDLERVRVTVRHDKIHAEDCETCSDDQMANAPGGRIDRFQRELFLEGALSEDQRQRLKEIADRCPVHRTLEASSVIDTTLADDGKA